jgi:hypothetical protein
VFLIDPGISIKIFPLLSTMAKHIDAIPYPKEDSTGVGDLVEIAL